MIESGLQDALEHSGFGPSSASGWLSGLGGCPSPSPGGSYKSSHRKEAPSRDALMLTLELLLTAGVTWSSHHGGHGLLCLHWPPLTTLLGQEGPAQALGSPPRLRHLPASLLTIKAESRLGAPQSATPGVSCLPGGLPPLLPIFTNHSGAASVALNSTNTRTTQTQHWAKGPEMTQAHPTCKSLHLERQRDQ